MKLASVWAPLLLASLALAGPLDAQRGRDRDRDDDTRRARAGWMGIRFEWRGDAGVAAVADVVDDSPAERAGIRRGDEVLRINGDAATEETVDRLRETLRAGETVRLRIRRGGREENRELVAAARPDDQVIVLRDGEVFTLPPGEGGLRMFRGGDTLEFRMDSLLVRMDSLRSRLRVLRPDSVFTFHFDVDTLAFRRLETDSTLRRFRFQAPQFRGRIEGLPADEARRHLETYRDLLGGPFVMELGRRALAGAELAEMNAGLGKYFHTDEGVLVLRVSPSTPAARAGLEPGDVIVEAGGRAVETVEDLREAFVRDEGGRLELRVVREGRRRSLELQWDRPDVRVYEGDRVIRTRPSRPRQ